ncbi:transcriptional regulator SWI6 KNAG_0C00650 [Huiozyma naganishii CBS 8797]|uniref:Swi6 N-terminal domain-containing protein n=1 Tax=Huiozyma naganishii (strain ATCC MYA-139 / BCRC 22969 / CBS 8797 / KCTC 17520 / NBRC 10181 / NCYC 3082 / Yp74L-3) TaxID=1071383 RepID=J7S4A3_HUIN7|nr:hypothetical protein KNAG_0C00650 [Kazachstania naganishii CBS 8797]CCK69179.1 hypothetical protein KNAG_0C00650 [Kazachstania naganishii CBS 8797]
MVDVTEFTADVGAGVLLTLKRQNQTGYFLLDAFIPILKQLAGDFTGLDIELLRDELQNQGSPLSEPKESQLLSRFGVLVDRDVEGRKWITGEKAVQLLDSAKIGHLFKAQLDSSTAMPETESTPEVSAEKRSSNNKRNTHSEKNELQFHGHHRDFDIENGHTDVGSPLKKIKLDDSLIAKDSLDGLMASNPIPIFGHDIDTQIIRSPLSLSRAYSGDTGADNGQRMKLESFLQRLLFPESSNNNGTGQEGATSVDMKSLIRDNDAAFPGVDLNLNIPVDEHGNTPLHWLTSIANLALVKELVKHGANRLVGDNNGETALVKGVKSVNNYDSGTFEELLDYLYPCLIIEDNMKRTILHHITITSGMAGCSSAAKYYLDILMGWIVKKETRSVDQGKGKDIILKQLTLKWVIANMLNAQDYNGDTSLNIAARLGNVAIVDALLDYGADPYIANKSGLRPVDFGAGTSKLPTKVDENNNEREHDPENDDGLLKFDTMKEPDTVSLINDMKTLLSSVSKDYDTELSSHKDKVGPSYILELDRQREELASSRDKLTRTKHLNDEYSLLKEQLDNITKGIEEEESNFVQESAKLGISAEENAGMDWDSSEFDADEPFRVDFIYEHLETKLQNEYGGDIEKLLNEESVENVMKQIRSSHSDESISNTLPPSALLKARINAYRRNDEYLGQMLLNIRERQANLEGKFRRVLSLCLKVDEDKVDGMLDGLLQAISSEDPQDIDTGEMQEFLNKHAIA